MLCPIIICRTARRPTSRSAARRTSSSAPQWMSSSARRWTSNSARRPSSRNVARSASNSATRSRRRWVRQNSSKNSQCMYQSCRSISTPCGAPSVAMFCFCFLSDIMLPIGLHSSLSISPTASGTCQKCLRKYHYWGVATHCTSLLLKLTLTDSATILLPVQFAWFNIDKRAPLWPHKAGHKPSGRTN